MRVLVLGGTAFIGRAIVRVALRRGWRVATFNRGRGGSDVDGVTAIRGDRYDAKAVLALAQRGPWDAVVDCSGYVPRNVLDVAQAIAPHAGRLVFMSTVSVYADWPVKPLSETSTVLDCPPYAGPDYGTDTENGPTRYGYQKAGCEAAAFAAFGGDRATLLRPGVVLGPREYVGRLPWWLMRVSRGGPTVAPGSPDRAIQPVDARDLAEFTLTSIERELSGPYNVTAPIGRETFSDLLKACAEVSGSNSEFIWVSDDELLAHGVRQWSEMPLWRTFDGVWKVDSTHAKNHGLTCRPLAETVRDTWSWLQTTEWPGNNDRVAEIGLRSGRERELLAAAGWHVGPS